MEEGYELAIKSIDIDGNKVYLELSKDGAVVDSKVISPSKDNPTMSDKTYYYKKDVGDSKDLVIIAAHFKNAFRGSDSNLATIDGVWQISDAATEVKVDTEYDKMRIASVSADTITMDNKDNTVTLSKNKDIDLMGDVNIKTADQDVVDDANPLRYYIYKAVTIEGAAANVTEAKAAETAATENVTEAKAAEAEATETVAEAEAAEAAETENATKPNHNNRDNRCQREHYQRNYHNHREDNPRIRERLRSDRPSGSCLPGTEQKRVRSNSWRASALQN